MPDYEDFMDWQAYHQLEPWGEERADWRMARIARAVYATGGVKKIEEQALWFQFDKPPAEAKKLPTAEELQRKFMRANANLGGKFVKQK